MLGWLYSKFFPDEDDEVRPSAKMPEVVEEVELIDAPQFALLKDKIDNILKISHHTRIKSAIKVLLDTVIPLLRKGPNTRIIDDVLTIELEKLDCVDIANLSPIDSGHFRQARREFAGLCHYIDDMLPHNDKEADKAGDSKSKKRRKKKR